MYAKADIHFLVGKWRIRGQPDAGLLVSRAVWVRARSAGKVSWIAQTEDFWLADLTALDTPENRKAWMTGTVEDWATESLLAARQPYVVPETGKRLRPGQKLGEQYHEQNIPVVRQRLYQAGVRLAWVLNEAFPDAR